MFYFPLNPGMRMLSVGLLIKSCICAPILFQPGPQAAHNLHQSRTKFILRPVRRKWKKFYEMGFLPSRNKKVNMKDFYFLLYKYNP